MDVLVIVVLLGLIPASIAQQKGRSFLAWWFFGAMIFIVALPMALMMKPLGHEDAAGMRKCSKCAELIQADASICKHCHSAIDPLTEAEKTKLTEGAKASNNVPGWLVAAAFGGMALFIWSQTQDGVPFGSDALFSSAFEIRVTGSSAQKFSDSYLTVTAGGKSEQKSVEGIVPETFRVNGTIASATLQKQSEAGLLKVEILKGGKIVATSDTTASYGVVSVSTN